MSFLASLRGLVAKLRYHLGYGRWLSNLKDNDDCRECLQTNDKMLAIVKDLTELILDEGKRCRMPTSTNQNKSP